MMGNSDHKCSYIGGSGRECEDSPLSSDASYCFWHDPDVDKKGLALGERLEKRAQTGVPMEGFQLKGADLGNLNLVNAKGEPFRLIDSNLNRANLQQAHLYRVDFSGSSLLKADLSRANLHRTNLSGCNLLGANFKAARIEHVNWGERFLQEEQATQAMKGGDEMKAVEYFEEAEEVARNIRKNCEAQGLFVIAGHYFHREMVFHRYRYPRWTRTRILSKLVDLLSGYGEKPGRVVAFSAVFIFICSICYFLLGFQDGEQVVQYLPGESVGNNLMSWLDALYFSVVTFTTLGYGDLTPIGFSRFFAALEAFTGSFTLALFVVVFVKKMTR